MIKINLAPSAKKGRVPKAKGAKAVSLGIKLPSIQTTVIYIIGIAILVVVIAGTLLSQSNQISGLNNNIKQLNTKLDELRIYKVVVDSLENRERNLAGLIKPIEDLNKNRFFIAHIIDEVAGSVPEFTWLTSLDITQTNIKLKGITASNLLVADFMNRLEDSPYIQNVDLTVLEKQKIEQQEMMDFSLTADVGYNP